MKRAIYFLVILTLLFGCKKKGGELVCTMAYNVSNTKSAELNTKAHIDIMSNRYTQFGDYITSITPSRFVGKFFDLRFLNNQFISQFHLDVVLVDNKLDIANPQRLADFSNNGSVSFFPTDVNVRADVELIYLHVMPSLFYQEIELPVQYENLNNLQYLNLNAGFQNNFDGYTMGTQKTGRFVKAGHESFVAPIFDPNWTGSNINSPVISPTYIFGNTNSTFIFYIDVQKGKTFDNPMGQNGYIVRSNKYNSITISAIPKDESKTIKGTMSFNTSYLIQLYAGQDNIPYTFDDIFVYAPNFWERISVTLEYY